MNLLKYTVFTNVHLPTVTPHHEVVSSLQAMQHQQQMINLARQNQFNQKILKQQAELLNLNKPDQNATNNVDSTDFFAMLHWKTRRAFDAIFHSPIADKSEKVESVFSPEEISDLASKNGLDKDEMDRLVEHYKIQNIADHDQSGKMRIGLFLKNHVDSYILKDY